jgi:hypothetical protein
MKTLTLQIFGLVFNLFLVFIIISYSPNFVKPLIGKKGEAGSLSNGNMKNTLALKKISIILVVSYIISQLSCLSEIGSNSLSFLDGKISINERGEAKTTFILIVSIMVLLNQNNSDKTEKYIIFLTNL